MENPSVHGALTKRAVVIALPAFLLLNQSVLGQVPGGDSSYFPLRLGNSWTYRVRDPFSYTETIVDTVRIRGLLYYALSVRGGEPCQWFRQSNDSVFVIEDSTSDPEYLLYDFAADTGDSWDLPPPRFCTYGWRVTLVSKEDTVGTSAGTFTGCYHMSHQQHCSDAGIYGSWFAKGVGRVRYLEDNFSGMIDYRLETSVVTSTRRQPAENVELAYRLLQSYPNPFNPSTVVSFQLPVAGDVRLVVFDLLGRDVATLVNEEMNPGIYETTFDGSGLASGIYLYRLNAGGYVETHKMLLLR